MGRRRELFKLFWAGPGRAVNLQKCDEPGLAAAHHLEM